MNNTRARSDEIQQAARSLLEDRNIDISQAIPIRTLADDLAAQVNCHLDTARRHLARAARLMRGEAVPQWGGVRPGAGKKAR